MLSGFVGWEKKLGIEIWEDAKTVLDLTENQACHAFDMCNSLDDLKDLPERFAAMEHES
jgi:hypothetical protein